MDTQCESETLQGWFIFVALQSLSDTLVQVSLIIALLGSEPQAELDG